MLTGRDDECRWVGGHHAWEDTGVDDEDVVRAVYLGVGVYDCCSAFQSAVSAELAGSHPVVCAAGADVAEIEWDLYELVRWSWYMGGDVRS